MGYRTNYTPLRCARGIGKWRRSSAIAPVRNEQILPAVIVGDRSCLQFPDRTGITVCPHWQSPIIEDFEVWVVDDGSAVPIKPLADAYGFGFTRIDGPSGPASRAQPRRGEGPRSLPRIYRRRCLCACDTLALFAEAFGRDPTVDAVVGSYDEAPACPNFISQYKNLFHHYVHQNSRGEIQTFWSGCGAMKRDLFLAFGGYDQQRYRRPACEDIDLGMRIAAAGHHIILDARIKAKHLKRWTFWNLLRTDVFDRGIPWTRLILRSGATICTLNVTPVQRLSVGLVYLTLLAMLTAAL